MKRYIHSSSELSNLDFQINTFLRDNLISKESGEMFGRGGYVYTFKVGDNVYRVFCDDKNAELIFQCVAVCVVLDDEEYYDDAQDYKSAKGNMSDWYNLIYDWINECQRDNPHFTEYIYEEN